MALLPEPIHTTVNLIYAAYEEDAEDGFRPHLGASLIGHECTRYLWMMFRWCEPSKFPGRMLRLFETGNREEPRLIENLRRIGVEVHDRDVDGNQWRVSAVGGHFGGSLDGMADNLPEAPRTRHVLEFKTSGDSAFKQMKKDRVQKSKPRHYAQMQIYMGLTGNHRAMYLMVNKNTDEIYQERIEFDDAYFMRLLARAESIIDAAEPPPRCSNDPSWYICKQCDMSALCHGDQVPVVNCRTCAHSTPELDGNGRWTCAKHIVDIPVEQQRGSWACHRHIPQMLENTAQLIEVVDIGGEESVVYQTKDGSKFANGPGPIGYTSQEIRDVTDKLALADANLHELRALTGAGVVA